MLNAKDYEGLELIEIDTHSIDRILNEHTHVLINFYDGESILTDMMFRVLRQVRRNVEGKVVIATIDVSEKDDISFHYGLKDLPVAILFREGKVVAKISGFCRSKTIIDKIQKNIE